LSLALLGISVPANSQALKQQLVGTWTFVSSTTKLPDGAPAWGTNPKGLLIFTQNGYYSSQIVRSDLPKFASNSREMESSRRLKRPGNGGRLTGLRSTPSHC